MPWKIIQIALMVFKNPLKFIGTQFYKSALGKIIEKYISHDIIDQIAKYSDITRLLDPAMLWNALNKANDREINALMKELKSQNKNERQEAIAKLNMSQTTPISLSSSWVKKGAFFQYPNSFYGELVIWINSETSKNHKWYGPYIYPWFSAEVWLKMKNAKSKYGHRGNPIGAGSVMWTYFLDTWLPSSLRWYVTTHANKDKMSQMEAQEQLKYIKGINTRFVNLSKKNEINNPFFANKTWAKPTKLDQNGNPILTINAQQVIQEATKQKNIMIFDKYRSQTQKQVIIGNSKQQLNKDLTGAQNSLYRLNKAINGAKGDITKLKNIIHIERQLKRTTKKTSKKIVNNLFGGK